MSRKPCSHLLILVAAVMFFSLPVFSQTSANSHSRESSVPPCWRVGTEIDLLPYLMHGYYGSAFAAHGAWRFRGVAARSEAPGFLVSDGFEKKRTDAYAALVDRFVGRKKDRLEGFWGGGGMELWHSRIRQEGSSNFTAYNNTVLTAGGGYVWRLSNNFYVNPWSAMHAVVGGNRKINVSGRTYEQPRFTPEVSVKFGIIF